MAPDNVNKKARMIYVTSNKYQNKIILLTFIPSILTFLSFIIFIFAGNPAFTKAVFHISFYEHEKLLNEYSGFIVFIICLFFGLSLMGSFVISHNMVGAFGRIIRELDEIIAGRSQRTISSRPNDTLSKDLLKRINVLVESYVKHEKKNI